MCIRDRTCAVAHNAGIRCDISFPILDFPSAWAKSSDEYINKGLTLRDSYSTHELINVNFGPHAPYTVSDDVFERIAVLAPELQATVQVHLHETLDEVEEALEKTGKRPLQRLYDLNVLTSTTQCVHMTAIYDSDI